MNKTLRNKALKDINKIFSATLNGEAWACPDGHFAIAYPIFDGYKLKKSQREPYMEHKPDLNNILPKNCEYIEADTVELLPLDINGTTKRDVYRITSGANYYDINVDYYNLVKNIYPDSKMYVDATSYNFTPIEVRQNNTLVAVLMPLKR